MQDYLLPLHKIVDTGVKYFGFSTGNLFYIVRATTTTITTEYDYVIIDNQSEYVAAITAPAGLDYVSVFPMGQEINFSFIFGL